MMIEKEIKKIFFRNEVVGDDKSKKIGKTSEAKIFFSFYK